MNIKVVTTYNNKLWDEYAHRFFETYNWPFDVINYNEDKDMFEMIPNCKNFVDRNKNRKLPKHKNAFKFDAVRFCYKVYGYTHSILNTDADGLICMDADSVFLKPIDVNFVKKHLHKEDKMMSYFGRKRWYSECGFLYFNMHHPQVKNYAKEMQCMYDSDDIYKLQECHDSYVWDYVRKQFESDYDVKNLNLTANLDMNHVQAYSVLAKYYDHCKGPYKLKGFSPQNKNVSGKTK